MTQMTALGLMIAIAELLPCPGAMGFHDNSEAMLSPPIPAPNINHRAENKEYLIFFLKKSSCPVFTLHQVIFMGFLGRKFAKKSVASLVMCPAFFPQKNFLMFYYF